jgi:hypothetical protein
MENEKRNIEQQMDVAEESVELDDEQMGKVSGGVMTYDDPRDKDHSNKKDDPKDWLIGKKDDPNNS